jgi:uncharacterized protein YcfJ
MENSLMKHIKSIVLVAALATATQATANQNVTNVKVFDHNKTVVLSNPVQVRECRDVKVPVYESYQSQGDAAGGAFLGMIIGGLLGKGVTGDDGGAAAGAVIGGLVGADKGAQPTNNNRIIGYSNEQRCEIVTQNRREEREVYSHSTIRFKVNGKRYVVEFQR